MTDNSSPFSMQWDRTKAAVIVEPDDEAALVETARHSADAFAVLYRRYVTPIYRYLYSRTGNDADAQDLTAQVFLEALEHLPRYRDRGNFAAWLFTIARRRAVDHYRRTPSVALDDIDDLPARSDPVTDVIERETLERLDTLVTQLDDGQRELLRLRFAGGLTFQQIGVVQGRSEAATKMALHLVLDCLRTKWGGGR